jgi:enoyl-CoA hydratase/carnithine racemase
MTEQPVTSPATPPVRVERDGVVATVVIDRPKALNALSPEVLRAIADAFDRLASEGDAVRGVLVVGEGGRAFVAGADIRSLAELTPGRAPSPRGSGTASRPRSRRSRHRSSRASTDSRSAAASSSRSRAT